LLALFYQVAPVLHFQVYLLDPFHEPAHLPHFPLHLCFFFLLPIHNVKKVKEVSNLIKFQRAISFLKNGVPHYKSVKCTQAAHPMFLDACYYILLAIVQIFRLQLTYVCP